MAGVFIPIQHLRDVLDYDAATGVFTRKVRVGRNTLVGERAGGPHHDGYRQISLQNRQFGEHRLAWAHHHGEQPPEQIDHINGDRSDNRICNLRAATAQSNSCNKRGSRPLKGTGKLPSGRWQASICAQGRRYYLGSFDSAEAAHAAYCAAAAALHRDFARFG